jgi:type I restriction enzyme, S subunit
MNVPQLRFKEFEDQWILTTLGDCSESLTYGLNAAAIPFDGENKYIRITDIDDASRKYINKNRVSPNGELTDDYLLMENDIVFARTGASTGKTYLYKKEDGKLYFAGFLIRARIKKKYNSKFIYNQTLTNKYYNWVKVMSMRSGQPGINSKEFASYYFHLPSQEEQVKISSFIDEVDYKINLQQEKIDLLKEQKKGFMQKIFTQELRFKDVNGEDFPEWKTNIKADELFEAVSNKNHNGNYPVLSATQENGMVYRETLERHMSFNPDNLNSYKLVEKNDFIISLRSFQGGIEFSTLKGLVSPAYTVFRKKNESVNNFYFAKIFKTENFITRLNSTTYGIRDGKAISYKDFSTLKFDIPSKEEQNKIAEFLDMQDQKISIEEKKLRESQNQKQAFMQQMFI